MSGKLKQKISFFNNNNNSVHFMPVCLVMHINPNNYVDFLLIKCRAIALFISVSDVRQGLILDLEASVSIDLFHIYS